MPLSVGLLRQSLNAWCRSKTPPDIKAAPLIIFINIVGTLIINVRGCKGQPFAGVQAERLLGPRTKCLGGSRVATRPNRSVVCDTSYWVVICHLRAEFPAGRASRNHKVVTAITTLSLCPRRNFFGKINLLLKLRT